MNEKTTINWYPGHMAKTKKQIIEDLKLIDVVIEIVDARIPRSSRNPDIEKITYNKKKIIVLNKCDLADETENEKWVSYLKKRGTPTVLVNANSGIGIEKILKEVESLMHGQLEKEKQKGRIGKNIRIMILRNPKCGKIVFNK